MSFRSFAFIFLSLSLSMFVSVAHAQSLPEEARDATVMMAVTSPAGRDIENGAGVILRADASAIYVITAAHVVELVNDSVSAGKIVLSLSGSPAAKREAKIVAFDLDIDLALVKIDLSDNRDLNLSQINTALIATEYDGEGLIIVGQGGGKKWKVSNQPDREANLLPRGNEIAFAGTYAEPGDSGGGVFDTSGRLVGILNGREFGDFVTAASFKRLLAFMEKNGLSYQANDAAQCLAGRRRLEQRGYSLSIDSLAGVFVGGAASALQLFQDACADKETIEGALREKSSGGTSVLYEIAKQNESEAELAAFFHWAMSKGLDPNLIVPGNRYNEHTLLSLAMAANNAALMETLLNSGATPNPFLNELFDQASGSRFLYPLAYLDKSQELTESEKQRLTQTFLSAGLFVPDSPDTESFFRRYSADTAIQNQKIALAQGGSLASRKNKLCQKKNSPWCAADFPIPRYLSSDNPQREAPVLVVEDLIYEDGDFGYFAVRIPGFATPATGLKSIPYHYGWGLLIANRDGSQLRLRHYQDAFVRGGLCNSNGTSRPPESCWRDRKLERVNGSKTNWRLFPQEYDLVERRDRGSAEALFTNAQNEWRKTTLEAKNKASPPVRKCLSDALTRLPVLTLFMGHVNNLSRPEGISDPLLLKFYADMRFYDVAQRDPPPMQGMVTGLRLLTKIQKRCAIEFGG